MNAFNSGGKAADEGTETRMVDKRNSLNRTEDWIDIILRKSEIGTKLSNGPIQASSLDSIGRSVTNS